MPTAPIGACGTVAAVAGTQSRYEWQFKQRLTSGGLNSQTAYLARNTSELARHLTGSDQGTIGQSGVLKGLLCSVVAATMRVSVGVGLGQFYDSTVSEPDSKAKWMELRAAKEVTLAVGDAANPRWDVIEIQPASVNGSAEVIDFFNPADNTFTPAVVSVLKLSEAALQVRAGTPNANPKLPAGVAGWMPLAYVYVAANALVLNVDRVLHCRPILTPRRGTTPDDLLDNSSPFSEADTISGGGFRVDANGLAGFVNTAMSGAFPNGGRPFYIPSNAPVLLSATGNYDGGGLPVADTVVYAYAARPPYPAGYDASLAPRELYIADTTTTNVAKTIPQGSRGCIIVFSSTAPFHTALGQAGSPSDTSSFTDGLWGSVSIKRSDMIYIGAAFYELAILGLMIQRVSGAAVATQRKPGKSFLADLPIAAPESYSLWSEPTGQLLKVRWPATATLIDMQVRVRVDPGDNLKISITDEFGDSSLNQGMYINMFANNDAAEQTFGDMHSVVVSDFGNVTIMEASSTGPGIIADLYGKCYYDAVLRMR